MRKLISILMLLCFACLAAVHAQAPVPVWLNKLKLSGLSGTPQHRLAVINNQSFALDEENDVKISGHTVRLKCLEIGQSSVMIYVQDTASRYALTLDGVVMQLTPAAVVTSSPQVVPIQPTPSPPNPPTPAVFNLPVASPATTGSNENMPPKTFSFDLFLFMGGIVLGFLLGIGLSSLGMMAQHNQRIKNEGEAMVAETISRQFTRPHLLLNNVTLPVDGGTTQIDHVLIADTGIFVIETKHYSGWIFGRPTDSQWTQQFPRKKSTFQNPLRQNFGHVKALQSLFDLPEAVFHAAVVFTGDAEFRTDLGPAVLRLSGLLPFLTATRPAVFDERKMAYVVGRIEMRRKRRSIETDEYHINHVRSKIAGKIPKTQNITSQTSLASPVSPVTYDHPHASYMPKI